MVKSNKYKLKYQMTLKCEHKSHKTFESLTLFCENSFKQSVQINITVEGQTI